MIEINLLPEELRIKSKAGPGPEFLLYLVPFVVCILFVVHIFLFASFLTKNTQLSLLNKKWTKLEPEKKLLEDLSKERNVLLQDDLLLQGLSSGRINWAQKLNKLSMHLPSGVWFTQINASSENFTLNGSVISFQKAEMNLINKFLESLKNDPGFFSNFTALELGSIQRKTIANYEVVDFVLSGKLK